MGEFGATSIGLKARLALHDPNSVWTVILSTRGAIYLESGHGEIVWIASNSAALHQRAVLLGIPLPKAPTVGTECFVEEDGLHVGRVLTVQLHGASVWSAGSYRSEGAQALEAAQRITAAIDRTASEKTPRGPLAHIVIPAAAGLHSDPRGAVEQALALAARQAIESLCVAFKGFDVHAILQSTPPLVGLGPGLTPSGDDFVGAFLFTLRSLHTVRPWMVIDWECVNRWLQCVRPLTNKISFAFLSDHAQGSAAALLHKVLEAGLDPQNSENLGEVTSQVTEIGDSSGWDMLTGVYLACSLAHRMLKTRLETYEATSPVDPAKVVCHAF